MNKKILSIALAFTMFAQVSVFADTASSGGSVASSGSASGGSSITTPTSAPITLQQYVYTYYPSCLSNGSDNQTQIFNYSTFLNNISDADTKAKYQITPKIIAKAQYGTLSYAEYATKAKPLSVSVSGLFDYKVTLNMDSVASQFKKLYGTDGTNGYVGLAINSDNGVSTQNKANLTDEFKSSTLKGEFTVTATNSSLLNFNLDRNCSFSQDNVSETKRIFRLKSKQTTGNKTVFTFNVNETSLSDILAKPELLNDLSVEIKNISATTPNTINTNVSLAGSVYLAGTNGEFAVIPFDNTANSANLWVTSTGSVGGGSGSSSSGNKVTPTPTPTPTPTTTPVPVKPAEKPQAVIVVKGQKIPVAVTSKDNKYVVNVDTVEIPEKEGLVFSGWYTNPSFSDAPLVGDVEVTEDTNIYPKYINTKTSEKLNSEKHIAYITGYSDGTIKPNANITREEVAAIFYRLLNDDFKTTVESTENSFSDVNADGCSNEAISTMQNAGFIAGKEDNKFDPSSPITRAEFVTIASHFATNTTTDTLDDNFTDVAGHWAEKNILSATNNEYWISGYSDKTFRPNAYITRAEAMTIINKMLVRYADMTATPSATWSDVSKDDWFYPQVLEAATEHEFRRNSDGYNETWTK